MTITPPVSHNTLNMEERRPFGPCTERKDIKAASQPPGLRTEGSVTVSRAYLESLTTDALIKMADNFGIDIPPDLDRVLIISELLEITSADENESGNSQETDFQDSVLTESVPLPKHYNITFIEVMIRDPLWAFVFWEIKAQDKEQFEKTSDFDGYYIKVSPWDMRPLGPKTETDNVFSVSVSPNDTAWYLGLTSVAAHGIYSPEQIIYKVELCAVVGGNETVLAVSNPIRLPELPSGPGEQEPRFRESPLVRLSGYGDFHILRRNERQLRTKRAASAGSYE